MSKVCICGSRDFDKSLALVFIARELTKDDVLICGMARGVDTFAYEYASTNGICIKEYPAKWHEFGRSAGMIRNRCMVKDCDRIVAIWDGTSAGTANTISLASKYGKPCRVYLQKDADKFDTVNRD